MLVLHVGAVHSHDANFQTTCGVRGCVRTYHLFRKHLWRRHQEKISDDQDSELDLNPGMEDRESCDVMCQLM